MQQTELIELLQIADSTFRKWRGALGITAKSSYPQDEVDLILALKERTEGGMKFNEAVASVTGCPPSNQASSLTEAIAKAKSATIKREAEAVAEVMAQNFEAEIWQQFFKKLKSAKPSSFDDAFLECSLALDSSDTIDAYFLEAADED